jgi:hypothetical protein
MTYRIDKVATSTLTGPYAKDWRKHKWCWFVRDRCGPGEDVRCRTEGEALLHAGDPDAVAAHRKALETS